MFPRNDSGFVCVTLGSGGARCLIQFNPIKTTVASPEKRWWSETEDNRVGALFLRYSVLLVLKVCGVK